MTHYKLLEPKKKPLDQRMPFYFFSAFMVLVMIYLVVIMPTQNGNWATWGVVSSPEEWIALNLSVFIFVAAIMVPVIRNGNRFDYTLAKIWANREYMTTEEHAELCEMLNYNTFKPNNAPAVQKRLQEIIDKNKGKHITARKYFKKEYVKDLEPYGTA